MINPNLIQPDVIMEIPADYIVNPAAFETQRLAAHESPDPTVRSNELAILLDHTQTTEGENLYELLFDRIDAQKRVLDSTGDAKLAKARAAETESEALKVQREKAHGETFRFGATYEGDIAMAGIIRQIPINTEAVKRQQEMAKKVAYGPKQNDTSRGASGSDGQIRRHGSRRG